MSFNDRPKARPDSYVTSSSSEGSDSTITPGESASQVPRRRAAAAAASSVLSGTSSSSITPSESASNIAPHLRHRSQLSSSEFRSQYRSSVQAQAGNNRLSTIDENQALSSSSTPNIAKGKGKKVEVHPDDHLCSIKEAQDRLQTTQTGLVTLHEAYLFIEHSLQFAESEKPDKEGKGGDPLYNELKEFETEIMAMCWDVIRLYNKLEDPERRKRWLGKGRNFDYTIAKIKKLRGFEAAVTYWQLLVMEFLDVQQDCEVKKEQSMVLRRGVGEKFTGRWRRGVPS
ncbi:hypothetical protein QBC35DRAFT_550635 [Podospora australis]|uniref:Uncharacterized protein n=1 Tax=Podospora australis TaxID=1536484 RepID=A0AAN6WX28_9PEZI|nr:hypothetical protein QBC35DRAFT_550635 [Podospora australis]